MACPNGNLLKSYKIYPKLHEFNYMREKFFVYIYLNPFTVYPQPYTVRIQQQEYCMAYEPLYVGKGSGGSGYRQNQHIGSFISAKVQNPIKIKWFKYIETEMQKAERREDTTKPWNWKEYKIDWIQVIRTFNSAESQLQFEVEMIQKIGTRWDSTGPLVNKIKNSMVR